MATHTVRIEGEVLAHLQGIYLDLQILHFYYHLLLLIHPSPPLSLFPCLTLFLSD